MVDLSILIPARNEMFLKDTVEDILKNSEASTEIIVVLDGQWAEPSIAQHSKSKSNLFTKINRSKSCNKFSVQFK